LLRVVSLTVPLLWLSPALAQSDTGRADRTALSTCLRDGAGMAPSCIGTVVFACLRQAEGAAAGRDVACARREQSAWRERLDAGLQTLGRSLDNGGRARLAALQRSFESYSAEKCALMADLAPPARTGFTRAACDLREVALRAIEVERQARGNTRQPSTPRLER
jgi:hypothetical protein